MTKTVAITLGAAGVYIILVVGLMMWCRYRRARRKALMLAQATADGKNYVYILIFISLIIVNNAYFEIYQ